MSEKTESKKYREEDEFFEEEKGNEQPESGPEPESEWLKKRQEWLRSLNSSDRDFIAKYGFELWEKKTGRKRDV
jgi:hypothetical protein